MSSERYNAIKRKLAAQNVPSATQKKAESEITTGRSERFEKIREKLSSGGFSTSMTADDVGSFLSDSMAFMEKSSNAYSGLTWEQATSEEYKAKRKETSADLSSRAGQVRSYLNANKADLNPESYESLMQYLDDFSEFQTQSALGFDGAYSHYGKFESEKDYDSFIRGYNQTTEWQQKYAGMSQAELQKAISDLEDGPEKDWVADYAYNTMTRLDFTKAVQSKKGELGMLIALQDEVRYLTKRLQVLATNSEEAKRATARKAEIYQQFGDLDDLIDATRAEIWKLENEEKYRFLYENEDYEAKSVNLANRPLESYLTYNSDEASYHHLTMDPSEIANFYYLVNTAGETAALEYLDYLNYELDKRRQAQIAEEHKKLATEHPDWANIKSIGANLISGIDLMDVAIQNADKRMGEAITGEYAGPINYYRMATPSTISTTIRSTRAQNIANKYGIIDINEEKHPHLSRILNGKSWGDVYQLGMSMADSAALVAMSAINPVLGKVGTVLLGGAAGTQAMLNAVEKGATDEQALRIGILSAAFETLFETYELESLLGQGENFWQALWRQSLSEAVGESATEAANILTDIAVMAEKSDYKQNILRYLAENPTWDYRKAEQQAFIDAALQVTESGAGGLISGGFMGGGMSVLKKAGTKMQSVYQKVQINKALRNLQTTQLRDAAPQIVAEALSADPNNARAKAIQDKLGSNEKLSSADLRTVKSLLEQSIVSEDTEIAAGRLKDLGETGDIATISRAVAKQVSDQKLTPAEKQAISESQHAKTVADELRKQQEVSYDTDDSQPVSEKRRNADSLDTLDNQSENTSQGTYKVSADGQAVEKATGEAITIREISSVKNGKMTFKTDSGTEIDAADVSYASEDEALVYETVARLSNNVRVANLLVDAYATSNVSGYSYAKGIEEAYMYGQFNISPQEMLQRGSFVKDLTDHQRKVAYDLGKLFAGKQISRELAAIRRNKKNGQKSEGKVQFDGDRSKLNDTQRTALDAMELLSNALGIRFYVFESKVDADGNHIGDSGWYDPKDGSIHIDLYAGADGKGTMLFTVAHELTHYIRQWSPVKFKILANYLMEQYGKQGVPVNELIEDQIAKAKRNDRDIGREEAFEELVADSMETMLTSGKVLQALADIRKHDRTLADKIRDWFRNFTEKLKGIVSTYKDVKPDSVEGKLVADMKDVISTFEALYGDALLDASENFDAVIQKNTADGGVKYSLRMFEKDGKKFVEIDQDQNRFDGHDLSEYPRIAKDIINEKFNGRIVGTDNKMFVNGSGRDEFANPSKRISDSLYQAKMRTAGELDNLLDAGMNFRNAPDGADGHIHADVTNGFDYFDTLFKIGNHYYAAVINIKNIKKGRLFKDVTKIEDVTQDIMSSYGENPKSQFLRTSSMDSISNSDENVNKKLSARDSTGKQLSEGQQEYFKDSKVRDAQGRLLVMYHGTSRGGFNIFNTYGSNYGLFGIGSYFTVSKAIGESYTKKGKGKNSQVYEVYLNIKNPLNMDNQADLTEWSKAFPDADFPKSGTNEDFYRVVENCYADKYMPTWEVAEIIQETIENNMGYDGITHIGGGRVNADGERHQVYIAFNPEQIKSISNRNPTDDPDIRHSSRDPAQRKVREALEQENAQLKEDVARLEELVKLQRTGTGGAKFTKTSVEAAARMLKKYANVKRMADTGELAKLLHTFYEYVATEKELSWEKVREQTQPAVQWLQEHVDLKEERSQYAQTILNQMKGSRIYLDESQKTEAAYRFGSYNNFRKAMFGKLTLVNEGNTSLDSWWHSMADQFPDVFHPATSSTDMPGTLFDIVEQLRNADNSRVEYEYNRASIAMDLTRQIYDSYWKVSTLYTVADRAQQKIDRLKSHHYQQMNKLRADQNARIEQIKEDNRADRQRIAESRQRTEVRRKILRVTDELNRLLLRDDKKQHVPDSLKKAVASAMSLLEIDPVNAVERITKLDTLISQATDPDIIDSLMASKERIREQAGNIGAKLRELHTAYAEIMDSSDPDIAAGYDPVIDGNIRELSKTIGNTPFSKLSLEQLEDVYSMYKMVLTRVRDANQSLVLGREANVGKRASRVAREILRAGGEHTHRVAKLDPVRKFLWDNLKPVFAFERLGSATLTEAYNDVRKGEETWIKDVYEAKKFYRKQARKHGYDSWDFKKTYHFESVSGLGFDLTLEQIMSLYAYSKRKQAHEHLRLGGFVFDSNIETYKEKDGKKSILKYKVNTADAHQLTPDILDGIIDNLSAEQRAFVDEMQDYLSSTMGAKGNEVSMKMYGVKLFKEKFYFPLKSAKQFLFEQNEVAGEVRIKSSGFTNKAVPKANNPIILNNFMDVWAGHVNDMSMYHSFVLPLEDFNRIFNYNSQKQEGKPSVSVKGTIQSAYTPAAVDYVKQLITDLNGGAVSDPRESFAKVMTSKFKKAKVMASLSVIIQQPSAIARAFALVNPAYFKPTIDGMNHSQLWEEVKKYAPVAVIKEMGYFDTGMGRSTIDFIKGKEYSGIKEKAKALVADNNYRDELLAKGPALADELTWCAIWNAVKRETKAKYKDLSPGTEAFMKVAGERFTEVITKTQVYDSVLARSAHMRSKSGLMNMATSFMAEPTTAINMLEDAIRKAQRGYKGYAARAIASVAVSIILNNALAALVYAMRDDDEDETYAEKYMQSFVSNMLDDINPVTYYPFLKDMWSLLQGFDVERADMSLIGDLADAMKRLTKAYTSGDGDVVGAWWDMADSVVNLTGFPLQNIRRDVVGAMNLINTVIEDIRNRDTTWGSMGDALESAVRDSLPVLGWLSSETKADKLYGAIINGNIAYEERLKNNYVDKDGNFNKSAYRSAIRKGLRNNDPRIKKAAKARLNGDHTTANNLLNQIAAEGHFNRSDIAAAIKAEYNHLKGD